MGFYKDIDGILHKAPNFVYSPVVTLRAVDKDSYSYPQDGWYWYDTDEEAETSLGVSFPIDESEDEL